ncbi:MAG: kynureninase [Roseovarius sp.]|nr:kynureninase [Roseovarius sp.]
MIEISDPFEHTREMFHMPQGVIYLNGNSLGPLPQRVPAAMTRVARDEWGEMLITGWNKAGWMAQPVAVGDRLGRLIGAEPGHVVLGETLSIKVYQALAAALELRPERRVILSDTGNFPSDVYMAEGLIRSLDRGHELRVVAPEDVESAITDEVAVVMLTDVDYRSARRHNMWAITAKAHAAGALTIWDLAHSAGAVDVHLASAKADFAVGCTYKYLNAGPGAPAFIYVAPRHIAEVSPALSGWLGHAEPFAFDPSYRAGTGIERMRVGTPPILALAALEAALDIWEDVDMQALYSASTRLSQAFIKGIEAACPDLKLASPRDPELRGSHVSFEFEHGYGAMQACIAEGVIGDFRAPDIMRFGITPLYLNDDDIVRAVEIIARVVNDRLWDKPEYKTRAKVT